MWVCVCVFRSVVGSELVFSDQRWWVGGWVRQHWWTVGYGGVDGCWLLGLVGVGLVFFFFFFFFFLWAVVVMVVVVVVVVVVCVAVMIVCSGCV